jgi:hypothetical protein
MIFLAAQLTALDCHYQYEAKKVIFSMIFLAAQLTS